MKRKLIMIVLVGFLLTLVNISIAGISKSGTPAQPTQEQQSPPAYTQQLVYHADAGKPHNEAQDCKGCKGFHGQGAFPRY